MYFYLFFVYKILCTNNIEHLIYNIYILKYIQINYIFTPFYNVSNNNDTHKKKKYK